MNCTFLFKAFSFKHCVIKCYQDPTTGVYPGRKYLLSMEKCHGSTIINICCLFRLRVMRMLQKILSVLIQEASRGWKSNQLQITWLVSHGRSSLKGSDGDNWEFLLSPMQCAFVLLDFQFFLMHVFTALVKNFFLISLCCPVSPRSKRGDGNYGNTRNTRLSRTTWSIRITWSER